ncbi:MAG: hypothetical protein K8R59_00570 [Thermoanaerobaculales bacterium]|nr:hypothetical protein [Thermoanaerobaculales bacterium]
MNSAAPSGCHGDPVRAPDDAADLCAVCGESARGEEAFWVKRLGGWVHMMCVPAWIIAHGPDALGAWLERGEVPVTLEGTISPNFTEKTLSRATKPRNA